MRRKRTLLVAALVLMAAGAAALPTYRYLVEKAYLKYNQWDRRERGRLKAGAGAPDLVLTRYEGGRVQLSELWRRRPLFLVFGSCT